jgi:hypothetical protein
MHCDLTLNKNNIPHGTYYKFPKNAAHFNEINICPKNRYLYKNDTSFKLSIMQKWGDTEPTGTKTQTF